VSNGETKLVFPPGLTNAYWFAWFNALSFQMVLGSPMILFAKDLGASATVLGIITGLTPLLVIFQIPAAYYVARVGYRRFVHAGWGIRVSFIFVVAAIPLTTAFLNPTSQLALTLLMLFCFNLSRGISSAGWLPWITHLVPEAGRGKYLSRDAAAVGFASFLAFVLAGFCLWGDPEPWQFALVFAFSGIMGVVSLTFLKRIPDVPVPAQQTKSKQSVPWWEMVRFPPFRKLLQMAVMWSIAYGGLNTFTVAFLKTEYGMSEGTILFVNSVSFLGGCSSLWFLGSRLDPFGSKPVVTFALVGWAAVLVGWGLIAARVWAGNLAFILGLQFGMGLLAAVMNMANLRLAMGLVPVMGRDHFFAIYSVVTSMALGLSPIGWGLFIDGFAALGLRRYGLQWNRYTFFFAGVLAFLGLTLLLARRLEEPRAATFEQLFKEVLIYSPQRVLLRFWPRQG
jgi:MFS family permease